VFCDIIAGTIPAIVVHPDDRCIAVMDIRPITPGHLLVVPLAHASSLAELDPATGGQLFTVAQKLAAAIRESGLEADGINFFLADGEAAGQECSTCISTSFHGSRAMDSGFVCR
jgi:histidine triad (HIT) family protein